MFLFVIFFSIYITYHIDFYVSQMSDPFGDSDEEENPQQNPDIEPEITDEKNVRGRTWMNKLIKNRSEGHLIPVTFNEYGQVIGTARSNGSSALGSMVRTIVPITCNSWNEVPA